MATFGAQTVLSELESIGRSNLTWPALPATDLGRTVLLLTYTVHTYICFKCIHFVILSIFILFDVFLFIYYSHGVAYT